MWVSGQFVDQRKDLRELFLHQSCIANSVCDVSVKLVRNPASDVVGFEAVNVDRHAVLSVYRVSQCQSIFVKIEAKTDIPIAEFSGFIITGYRQASDQFVTEPDTE